MSASDVIRDLVAKVYSGAPFPSKRSLDRAIDVLDALEDAGYRILGPDELDPVTVERIRTEISRLYPHYQSIAATDAARRQMLEYLEYFTSALIPEAPQPEAKESREDE